MKLKCLGAGHEVGRSGFLIIGSDKILFDYGLKLNPKYLNEKSEKIDFEGNIEQPIKLTEQIDAVVLSHAHLDHSGNIPSLYKKYSPNLFLTQPTLDLSTLLWKDTLKIAKFEKKTPPFEKEDMYSAQDNAYYLKLRETVEISKYSKLTLYDAGHIVGSSIAVLEMDDKKIMYTGDFRASDSSLFSGYDRDLPEVDYLIIESTYGQEIHVARQKLETKLITEIEKTISKKGIVILAAFAIERTQELISLLNDYKIKVPIYVDGMGVKATDIFLNYSEYFKNYKEFKKATKNVKFITDKHLRKKVLNETKPCVIVTTAGMLEGGPILLYLKEFGDNTVNKLIMTGYQVEGTNGHRLNTTGKLFIDGDLYTPECEIKHISLSGHPDKDELLEFINLVNPKKVICVHGDSNVINEFTEIVRKEGYLTEAPLTGDTIEL
jgi:putative mRNA 3-end processing factor